MRRPLIEEYRRSWGVARTIKRLERDVEEVQRSPRSGDVTQQIYVAGGGGSSGGGSATPTDRIFDTAVLNGIIAGVNDVQFYNGGVLGGAFRSAGFQVYDGGDILMWSGAYPGTNQTGYWNGANGEIAFFDDAFANRVGIRGPAAAQADNWVIRLPADDPAVGEILAVQGIAGSLVQTEWAAAAAPGAHALVSASHTGEADYTSTLGLLGLGVGTGDLIIFSDAGTTEVARWAAATGHLTIGPIAADASTVMKFNKNFTDPAGVLTGIGAQIAVVMTTNNSLAHRGLATQINASGAFVASGILTAEHNTVNVAAGGVTADDMRNLDLLAVVGAASTLGERSGLRVRNATGSGTVTLQHGIYLENMTKGATDWAIYSLGGNSSHLGAFTLGANTAPHASAILDLASTTLGLLIPRIPTASLPAGVNGLIVYDSTTNKFVAYENGAYANMIGGGGGAVATDVIWDAKGDLAVGTGANTAIRLAVGADDTIVMADAATATGLKYVASATPSTQAFGDTAAVGTGDTFTRGDHKHAMPADPVTAHAAAGDPHTGYVREADANWIDLTDTGATTLHSHAGGGGTNVLLDGATHTDTLADTVTDGDVIIGNVTPKWSSLAISIPVASQRNVFSVDNGELRPSWKAILGDQPPEPIGTAAPGTGVLFASRRNHIHATGAGTPSTQAFGDAASVGTGPAAAMTDHKHAMPSATITKHILLVGGTPTTTAYAASAQRIEFGTNDRDDTVNDFGATAKEHIFWKHPLPGWDGGTVTATFYWYVNSAATTSVRWGLEAVSSGDGSAMDSAFGTPQEVTDALDGTAYHLRISGATPAITVAGAGNNELVTWRAYRDPTNGADDCTSIARLSAILVTYTGAVT